MTTTDRSLVADQLRGLAALQVAAYHCLLPLYPDIAAATSSTLLNLVFAVLNGGAAVVLFFVLSGYVLGMSLDRAVPHGAVTQRFLIRRVFRIFPAWMLSLLLGALIIALLRALNWPSHPEFDRPMGVIFDAHSALRHVAMLDVAANPVGWTLQVEVFSAPIILIGWWLSRHSRAGMASALIATVVCLGLFYDKPLPDGVYLAQYAFMFILGVQLPSLLGWIKAHPRRAQLERGIVWLLPIALLLWTLPVSRVHLALVPHHLLATGIGALLILLWAQLRGPVLGRAGRAMNHAGKVSYSFYLLHYPVLMLFWASAKQFGGWESHHPLVFSACMMLLSMPCAYLLSIPVQRWVEQGGIGLGRWVEEACLQRTARATA